MATFEELFPYEDPRLFEPFDPIKPKSRAGNLNSALAAARSGAAAPAGEAPVESSFDDVLNELRGLEGAAPAGDTAWSDFPKAFESGVGSLGSSAVGIGEYGLRQLAGKGETPLEQTAQDMLGGVTGVRQDLDAWSQAAMQSMTPEAQQRISREFLTLDPNKTIWQGGTDEFLSSLLLKVTQSAPSSLATLLPGALMFRAGLGAGAISYLGASEGALSMGSIATNIANEIDQAPEEELMQSERYKQLRSTMGEREARDQLIQEAQGAAPAIAGLVVGSISSLAGKYLEPVFIPESGLGVMGRIGRGAVSEGVFQEAPQSGAEQIAQNIAAQVYDTGRSTWEGVPEQVVQGGALGAVMGGGTLAAVGPRRPPPSAGLTGAPETPPGEPQVDGDIAAAIHASQAPPAPQGPAQTDPYSGQTDMFPSGGQWDIDPRDQPPPPGMSPQQEQASYLQRPWPVSQGELDLENTTPGQFPPPANVPQQLPLGLRQRQRGGLGEVIEPTPSPFATQEPEARPGDYLPPRGRPTRADFIRAQQRATEQPVSPYTDPAQMDLFQPPPDDTGGAPPPPPGGAPPSQRTLEGIAVRARDAQGNVKLEDVFETREQANAAVDQISEAHPELFVRTEPVYSTTRQPSASPVQDTPSAEPLSDLRAQLDDLADPDSPRLGVYLAPDNIRRLRSQRAYEQVRGTGVPLGNFDGKGGVLIAKDEKTAKQLLAMREQGTDMQELLGLATGAGTGKPMGDIVVQLRDDSGNVTRESLVASPEQADALVSRWEEETGQEAVVLSSAAAIRRRSGKLREESAGAYKKKRRGELVTAVERAIPGVLPEVGTPKPIYQARAEQREGQVERAMRGAKTPEEAGQNVAREAGRRELQREIRREEGIDAPDEITFGTHTLDESYRKLYQNYTDMRTGELLAEQDGRTADALEFKTKAAQAKKRIAAFMRLHDSETVGARSLARAASELGVTRANVETRLRAREAGEDVLGDFEPLSDEQVRRLSDEDLDVEFVKAAERASGDRIRRISLEKKLRTGVSEKKQIEKIQKEVSETATGRTAEDFEQAARTEEDTARMAEEGVSGQVGEASGRTFRELVAAHPTRSQKILMIRNLSRRMRDRQYGSKRSRPFTRTTKRSEAQVGGITVMTDAQISALSANEVNKAFRKAAMQYLGTHERSSLTSEPLKKMLRDHPRVSDRREYLRRVHGKWRAAGETRVPITQSIPKRHGKFNPAVLFATEPTKGEMEASEAERKKQRTRHDGAVEKLQSAVSKSMAAFDTKDVPGTLAGEDAVFARAYLRTVIAYGQALSTAKPQSYKGIEQMEIVAKTLNEIRSEPRAKQVQILNALMQAEGQEQVALMARGNESILGSLKDPSKRAELTAQMILKKQAQVARLWRIQNVWGKDPYYRSSIAPLLRKIVNIVDAERTGHNPALAYPTEQEMKGLRFAMRLLRKRFGEDKALYQKMREKRIAEKVPITEREERRFGERMSDYDLLRRSLYDAGVRFNEKGDVLIPTNEKGEYEWTNDRVLDAIWRRRFGKEREAEGALGDVFGERRTFTFEEANREIAAHRRAAQTYFTQDALTAEGAKRLGLVGTVNDAINVLRDELQGKPTAVQVMATEQRFIDKMKNAGLWKPVGKGGQFGRISLPGVTTTARFPIMEGKTVTYGTRLVRGPERQITVRLVGPQLRKGSMTVAAAREQMLSLYKPMPVNTQSRAEMISQLESIRQENMTPEQRRLLEALQQRDKPQAPESFEQVARDRTVLSTKEERARQQNLTPEQRAVDRSYRQRERARRTLKLIDDGGSTTQYRTAGEALMEVLDRDVRPSLTSALTTLWRHLPSDTLSAQIAQRIIGLNMSDVTVAWEPGTAFDTPRTMADYDIGTKEVRLNRDYFDEMRARGTDAVGLMTHNVLHESVHAATQAALQSNPALRSAVLQLLAEVRNIQRAGKSPYGLTNEFEFVAEAFSNPQFQELLRTTFPPSGAPRLSLWQRFVNFVQRALGMQESYTQESESALDLVMGLTDDLFLGEALPDTPVVRRLPILDAAGRYATDVIDRVEQGRKLRESAMGRATEAKQGASSTLLSAMTLEQIRNFFHQHFIGENGYSVLDKYWRAFSKRGADNSASLERADRVSRKWTELTEQGGTANAIETSEIMTEATRHGVHPDLPLVAKENQHIQLDRHLSLKHTQLMRRFQALPQEWQDHYTNVRKYYADTLEKEIDLATLNALRAYTATGAGAPYTHEQFDKRFPEGSVKRLKLNTKEGLRDAFREEYLSDAALDNVYRMSRIPSMVKGPYFPMSRFGDYAVYARKLKETKTFSLREDYLAFRAEQLAKDPSLDIHSTRDANGDYQATVHESEFRLAETMTEAKQNETEMVEEYGRDAVTPVQLRNRFLANKSAISGDQSLRAILDKLGDNEAAKTAIKDFYLRSLGERSFRKHESRRKFTRGVNDQIQHRAFQAYSLAASYYMAQLRYGWKMAEAKREMQKVVSEHRDESEITSVRMGQILKEIQLRDEMTTSTDETPKMVRRGVELSHFMLLASPSYAMINMTQPWLVGIPWLGARYGLAESASAMGTAQKLIASPLLSEAVNSWGGMKALFSKMAGERAFTVIDQIIDEKDGTLVKKLGKEGAKPYIDLLQQLRRQGIVDLSLVSEIRAGAEGIDTSATQRVLDASRIMAHLTEVNNRVLMAIATYDLATARGADHGTAVEAAGQAVSMTQFNYSAGNKPRLFQSKGTLGKYAPLAFQFMQYPQHLYALMVGEYLKATRGGGLERKQAIKTLTGLALSHLAVGGMLGAMIQPAKWMLGMIFAAFSDDDDRWQDVLSGETFDRHVRETTADVFGTEMGLLASKGIPAALGADLSSRMSLGTLYFIDMKPETAESFWGSLFLSFGGPWPGLISNGMRGAQYMAEGEPMRGLEYFMPKGAKDFLRFTRYANDGLTTASGNEIIAARDMKPTELFLQSMGFNPTRVSEAYEARTAIQTREETDDYNRQILIRRFTQADDADDRQDAREAIREYNRTKPVVPITYETLLRSRAQSRTSDRNTRRFGMDLRGRRRRYAEEAEPYAFEVEE